MPYVDSVKVLLRVVELGSITAAGRDQRLTPAVASNRIKELERRLGVRLFNRTTRKLALTETGRLFYEHAEKIIESVESAEAAIAGFAGKETIAEGDSSHCALEIIGDTKSLIENFK